VPLRQRPDEHVKGVIALVHLHMETPTLLGSNLKRERIEHEVWSQIPQGGVGNTSWVLLGTRVKCNCDEHQPGSNECCPVLYLYESACTPGVKDSSSIESPNTKQVI
jgi:hypothetical protein